MGDNRTLNSEKQNGRWGPVYQDEYQSLEVRSLNATEKELWTALAFRTRSAKKGAENISGTTVRYDDLALDIGKLDPATGTVKPVNKKTVQRAMQGLLRRGLVHLTLQYRRPPRVVMLRPPSICGRCATQKSCLHRRSPIDHDFLKKIGVVTKFSTDISTCGQSMSSLEPKMSTQTGHPDCPPRMDTLTVHTGSDPIQNSYSKFDGSELDEKKRIMKTIAAQRQLIEQKGVVLPEDATNKEVHDSFVELYCKSRV